jgi:preprotein translocase subunit SecG
LESFINSTGINFLFGTSSKQLQTALGKAYVMAIYLFVGIFMGLAILTNCKRKDEPFW